MSGKRDYAVVGGRGRRLDGPEKVTGAALYADDLTRPNMLYGALLHSPIAHGRIVRIDTRAAEALAGVEAVICARDIPDVRFGVSPARYDERVFCQETVRYVGDEVAAVAAVDEQTALQALELIEVEYEELPPVLDHAVALAEDAAQVHPNYPGNICAQVEQEFGDLEAARDEAYVVRTGRMSNKMQNGAFLEPQCALAEADRDGRLTLWSSTQSTHYVARTVSMVTGLPEHRVRVIMPRVGGGFGPKAAASSMELATCFLALKTGRPVKTTFTREQVFWHSRARHQFFHEMTLGVDRQGKLLFLDHEAVLDGGAYASFGIATVYYAGSLLGAPYRLPAMRYKGVRAVTNKPASGAQRGHGGVIARALFEQQLDLIARDLGMDPVDLRLRNVMEAGDETVNNLAMSSLGMKECLEAVQKSSGWAAKRKGERAEGRGIGVACGFFVSGAGYPIYRSRTPHCTVEVKLDEVGGGVEVRSGAAEIGQGVETMLATVVAETLGIPVQRVRVRSGDSDLSLDLGAYSSRTTLMTGHAAREAAEGARAQLLDAAAAVLGVLASELEIRDDRLWVQGGAGEIDALRTDYIKEHRGWLQQPGGDHLTFTELSRLAFLELGTIVAVGRYSPPELGGKFKGAAVGTSPAYGCSAQVAEVQVDHETGEIQVQRITAAHDCGQAINRTQVEGQMQGCTSMGLGEALMEEVVFDEQGKVLNPTMADYKIPTALDMPPVDTLVIESDEPNGPFGAKEVGEGGIMPVIPAILNAIHDATGVTIDELPATPARILAGLGSEEQGTGDKE